MEQLVRAMTNFRAVDRRNCESCDHHQQSVTRGPSCRLDIAHYFEGDREVMGFKNNHHAQESICNYFTEKKK